MLNAVKIAENYVHTVDSYFTTFSEEKFKVLPTWHIFPFPPLQ